MAKRNIDSEQVKKLVELVERHNLGELTVTEGELEITVKGKAEPTVAQTVYLQSGAAPLTPAEAVLDEEVLLTEDEYEEDTLEEGIYELVSPLVGVFYRAPSPEAPNFCEVGDDVVAGTEVGLIEAMKVFSPIPSEVDGKVVEIVADNGKLVQSGEVIMRIKLKEG